MSTSADIVAQLIAALKQSGLAGQQVSSRRADLVCYRSYPTIGVFRLQDVPSGARSAVGTEMRQLTIELRLLAAEGAVDELHQAVTQLLAQQPRAGEQWQTGGVEWRTADENPALGIVTAQYHVTYRRMEGET